MVDHHAISAKDLSRLHRQESLTKYILGLCTASVGESGKETFWSQTIEELEKMDASEIHAVNAHEW